MRLLLSVLALAVLLAGRAPAEVPKVVADIPPVHSLVAQVMGNVGNPVLLTTGAGDPHRMQLRPSQARALAGADVVFWMGPALTPWLESGLAALAPDAVNMPLLALPGTNLRGAPGSPDALDPHAWLDPENARIWLRAIARALSDADPNNQATYLENAAAAIADLDLLLSSSEHLLANAKNKQFVFAHDAYGYFAERFGLQIAGVVSDSNANKPGAAHLKEVERLIQSGSVACVFGETQQNPALLRTLTRNAPVTVAILDPVGITLDPGPGLYRRLIENLAAEIADCIGE